MNLIRIAGIPITRTLMTISRFPGVLKYFGYISFAFFLNNIRSIITLEKTGLAEFDSVFLKIFYGVFVIPLKLFAKKVVLFDIGIYENVQLLKHGPLPLINHAGVLIDVFLGLIVIFCVVYTLMKIDAISHSEGSNALGLGPFIMGVLVLVGFTWAVGMKELNDLTYYPFKGVREFFSLVWGNPDILKISTTNGFLR